MSSFRYFYFIISYLLLPYYIMSTASQRSSYTIWIWLRLWSSLLIIWVQPVYAHFMLHEYGNAYPHLYYYYTVHYMSMATVSLYEYIKFTLILHYMSMASPMLIPAIIIWIQQPYAHLAWYDYCNAYAHLYYEYSESMLILHYTSLANAYTYLYFIIWIQQIYAHLTL